MAVQLGSIQHTAPCFKLANTANHVLQQIEECEWSANSTTTSKVIQGLNIS